MHPRAPRGMQHPAQLPGAQGKGRNWPKPEGKEHLGSWSWERNLGCCHARLPGTAAELRRGRRTREHLARSLGAGEPGAIAATCFYSQLPQQTRLLATTEQGT